MTSNTQELVGLEAYSRDGEKIGKVKDVICDPESDTADCLVIKYGLFRDLVVPADVVQKQGERITVPFTHSFSRYRASRWDEREAVEQGEESAGALLPSPQRVGRAV